MQSLEGRIDTLDNKLDELNNNVLRLQGQMMPRAEIESADNRRVSLERFEGEVAGVRERLTRLESGPQRLLGWIALVVSASVGCLSLVIAAVGILTTILITLFVNMH